MRYPRLISAFAVLLCLFTWVGCHRHGREVVVREAPPPPVQPVPIEPPRPAVAPAAQVEVLTRGPVHEAFAEPVVYHGQGSIVVSEQPPEPIAEDAPEEMVGGQGFVWVPGYWSWDDDRDDFIWVSGCWRIPPPGCSWMPGYWVRVSGGYQWIPGFWMAATAAEVEYLPTPPEDVAEAVPGPPPQPDEFWVPGCWRWRESRYVWVRGSWAVGRSDWIWMPAHYMRTPRGCIFVEGYWDYVLVRRGVLFAPVYCPPVIYRRPGFIYSPTIVVDVQLLPRDLFCSPSTGHYYFGDYYAAQYVSVGIYPWYEVSTRHGWYDPIYTHERWRHRGEKNWDRDLVRDYDRRRGDSNARPAHTYRELQQQTSRLPEKQRQDLRVVHPLSELATRKDTPLRFEPATPERRVQITQRSQEVRTYGQQRERWEAPAGRPEPQDRATVREAPKTPLPVRPPAESRTPEVRRLPSGVPAEVTPTPQVKPSEAKVARHMVRQVAPPEAKPEKIQIPRSPVVGPPREAGKEKGPPPPPAESDRRSGNTDRDRQPSGSRRD